MGWDGVRLDGLGLKEEGWQGIRCYIRSIYGPARNVRLAAGKWGSWQPMFLQ